MTATDRFKRMLANALENVCVLEERIDELEEELRLTQQRVFDLEEKLRPTDRIVTMEAENDGAADRVQP